MSEHIASTTRQVEDTLAGRDNPDSYMNHTVAVSRAPSGLYEVVQKGEHAIIPDQEYHDLTMYRWKGAALLNYAMVAERNDDLAAQDVRMGQRSRTSFASSFQPEMREIHDVGGREVFLQSEPLHRALEQAASWQGLVVEGTLSDSRVKTESGRTLAEISLSQFGIQIQRPGEEVEHGNLNSAPEMARILTSTVQEHVDEMGRVPNNRRIHQDIQQVFEQIQNGTLEGDARNRGPADAVHLAQTDYGFRMTSLNRPFSPFDTQYELTIRDYSPREVATPLGVRPDLNAGPEDAMYAPYAREPLAPVSAVSESFLTRSVPALEITPIAEFMKLTNPDFQAGTTVSRYVSPVLDQKIQALGGPAAVENMSPMLASIEGVIRETNLDVRQAPGQLDSVLTLQMKGHAGDLGSIAFRKDGLSLHPSPTAAIWSKDARESSVDTSSREESEAFGTHVRTMLREIQAGPALLEKRIQTFETAELRWKSERGSPDPVLLELAPVLREDIQSGRLANPSYNLNVSTTAFSLRAKKDAEIATEPKKGRPPSYEER